MLPFARPSLPDVHVRTKSMATKTVKTTMTRTGGTMAMAAAQARRRAVTTTHQGTGWTKRPLFQQAICVFVYALGVLPKNVLWVAKLGTKGAQ